MKKLLILTALLTPLAALADEEYQPSRAIFVGGIMGMIGARGECFNKKIEDCPTVWVTDGVVENYEDTDAVRECQQRAWDACYEKNTNSDTAEAETVVGQTTLTLVSGDKFHANIECFLERYTTECPALYQEVTSTSEGLIIGDVINPEDEDAVRECQERLLESCQSG